MEWAIGCTLNRYLNGRELVIWGTGPNAFNLSGIIARCVPISFYISRDAKLTPVFMGRPVYEKTCVPVGLSPQRHYVVILADSYYTEIRDDLNNLGFEKFEDFYDWFPDGTSLFPFDTEYKGVCIGKFSYFPRELLNRSKSIGRFTSIHTYAHANINHQMNMVSTGALEACFSKASLEQFRKASGFVWDVEKRPRVTIGNDVWIGANVFINTSKVATIGDGAIIGSNSLLLHDVPPYAIVYGTPAKVQRYRFTPEQIEILLRVKWWEWDNKTIDENADLLIYPEKFFEKFG